MSEERQFSPTAERRIEARRKGQSPRGHDLTAVAVILGNILFMILAGSWWLQRLREMLVAGLSSSVALNWHRGDAEQLAVDALACVGLAVLPIAALAWCVAVVTQLAQGGWSWFPARILPDWQRIDPVAGCGRLWQGRIVIEGLLVILRLGLATTLCMTTLWLMRDQLVLPSGDPEQSLAEVAGSILFVLAVVCATFGVVALAEFGYRWWIFEDSLRMTAEEFRTHQREQEGDLRVRAMQRGAHQELSRRLAAVPGRIDQAATTSRE